MLDPVIVCALEVVHILADMGTLPHLQAETTRSGKPSGAALEVGYSALGASPVWVLSTHLLFETVSPTHRCCPESCRQSARSLLESPSC